jgi:hypothetical protein
MIAGTLHTSNTSTNKHLPTTTDAGCSYVTVSDPPPRND